MLMKNPPHPGRLVKREIEALGLTITEAAAALGVSRQALNNLVNEKSGISAEMAIRLSKALGNTPDTWIKLWAQYDLAQAMKGAAAIKVRKLEPAV
jgi:antitoxin HigA-1